MKAAQATERTQARARLKATQAELVAAEETIESTREAHAGALHALETELHLAQGKARCAEKVEGLQRENGE